MNPPIQSSSPETVATDRFRQVWLLPPARPLTDRIGRDFFLNLPKSPGVYLMHGVAGRPPRPRILYVGKARNLRQRLDSYRHVHPDRDSRKTVRLVHAVDRITVEPCADEVAALLRENELLREHRPLFNRVNIWPEAHGCVGFQRSAGSLEFRLAAEPVATESFTWHGSFKGGRRFALAALLRLLHQVERGTSDWADLPRELIREKAPMNFALAVLDAGRWFVLLNDYFQGVSWKLVDELNTRLESVQSSDGFLRNWRESDLEMIRKFYLNGPRRNRRWRQELNLPDGAILRPEDLDDLPIKIKLAAEPSPWPEKDGDGTCDASQSFADIQPPPEGG